MPVSEWECQECWNKNPLNHSVCSNCGGTRPPDLEVPSDVQTEPAGPAGRPAVAQPGERFGVLLGYGKLVSAIGWFGVFAGAIGIIWGISTFDESGLIIILSGIAVAIYGLVIVVSGQTIACFVSIERNTRQTYELLLRGNP